MTTTKPTRREAELQDMLAYEKTFRDEVTLYQTRLADLDNEIGIFEAEIARLTEQRAALMEDVTHGRKTAAEVLALRDTLTQKQAALRDLYEVRDAMQDKLSYAHTQHSGVHQDVARASLAVVREPAEIHLRAIDDAFRSIEEHWRRAATEGQRLTNHQGDDWALNVLRRWGHELAHVTYRSGFHIVEFPHVEEPA